METELLTIADVVLVLFVLLVRLALTEGEDDLLSLSVLLRTLVFSNEFALIGNSKVIPFVG